MDTTIFQKIKDAITKSTSIGIVVGKDPSLDQMAAALSLYLSLKKINKQVAVASPTNPIVDISSLIGIDKVQTNLGGETGDLVVSFPYNEGEIDKVSYTLENSFLNIIVKAGEKGISFNEKDVRYVRGSGSVDLLFVIGTPRLSDLGELLGGDKLRGAKIINIDNKSENQGFGDIVMVSPKASSISEQVTEVIVETGLGLDQDISQNLLSGIVFATNDFKNQNSTALAFEMAGILMQKGATRMRDSSASSAFVSSPQIQPMQSFNTQPIQQPLAGEKPEEIMSQRINQIQPEGTAEQKLGEGIKKETPIDWLAPKVYQGSTKV